MDIARVCAAIVVFAPALTMASPGTGEAAERIAVTSPAFHSGADIPMAYTCQGKGVSPPLAWSNMPPGVKSFAFTVDDPDAPKPPFVHWVLYDIPASASALEEGVPLSELPPGTLEGMNSAGKTGYVPPCPPSGRHRYFFRVYALDTTLAPRSNPITMKELEKAIKGHVIARGELMGTYQKTQP